jgi:hypothetical protein
MSVNDPGNFHGRVRYALEVISAGRPTCRTFDSCFENGDGDEVAAAVYRRSLRRPTLAANLWRYLSRPSVTEVVERLAGVADRDMADEARRSRARIATHEPRRA